jgi:hypothetical protein
MEAGKCFLSQHFIDEHNRRFAIMAKVSESAYQRVPKDVNIKITISFRHQAVAGNDNAVA